MCLLSWCFCFADVHIVSLLCLSWVKYHYFHPEILLPFVGNFGNSQWSFMLLSTRALQNPPMRYMLPGNGDLLGQTPQGCLAPVRPAAAARTRVTGVSPTKGPAAQPFLACGEVGGLAVISHISVIFQTLKIEHITIPCCQILIFSFPFRKLPPKHWPWPIPLSLLACNCGMCSTQSSQPGLKATVLCLTGLLMPWSFYLQRPEILACSLSSISLLEA